jgi:hypothetical protein
MEKSAKDRWEPSQEAEDYPEDIRQIGHPEILVNGLQGGTA